MNLLTKEQIATRKPKRELATIRDFGDVYIREMTAKDGGTLQRWLTESGSTDPDGFYGQLFVRTVVNEDGERLFSDGETEVAGNLPLSELQTLVEVALRLNKMRPGDRDTTLGNSPSSPSDGSPSA